MSDIKQKTVADKVLLFNPDLLSDISDDMFDASYWQAKSQIIGQAFGRGTTTFFCHQQNEFVLRHYHRGGLIGKVVKDQYVYTGLKATRAYVEMHLLNTMHDLGLAVPRPAAARIEKKGLFYQADIILQKITGATDAFTLLQSRSFAAELWHNIGREIKRLHEQQIYHHDLNIHNIMLDEQNKVWLIDFDKCEVRDGDEWKNQNLQRLQRSLVKEKTKKPEFYWQPEEWQSCLMGYHHNEKG